MKQIWKNVIINIPNDMWFEIKVTNICVNKKIIKHRIHAKSMCNVFVFSFYILKLEAFNFWYNISFIDPPLGGFGEILPHWNIITSGNISPNPPRSRSINDKKTCLSGTEEKLS
jgi:hypothetical protein